MKTWIEVSSEYRFQKKLDGQSGLYAPARTRHINQMKEIQPEHIILHYITLPGAIDKENGSSIIGISKVKNSPIIDKSRITVELYNVLKLPKRVNIKELKSLKIKSSKLKTLLDMNFQRYLAEIGFEDLTRILVLYVENKDFIVSKKYFDLLSE